MALVDAPPFIYGVTVAGTVPDSQKRCVATHLLRCLRLWLWRGVAQGIALLCFYRIPFLRRGLDGPTGVTENGGKCETKKERRQGAPAKFAGYVCGCMWGALPPDPYFFSSLDTSFSCLDTRKGSKRKSSPQPGAGKFAGYVWVGGLCPLTPTFFSSLDGRKEGKRRSRRQGAPAKPPTEGGEVCLVRVGGFAGGRRPSLPGACGWGAQGRTRIRPMKKKKEGYPHGYPYNQKLWKITSLSSWGYIRRRRRRLPVWDWASGLGSVWDPAWASDRAWASDP